MNISNLKSAIAAKSGASLPTLMMVRQMEQDDATKPTPWLSHWDNDTRSRIAMHEDVFNLLKANPLIDTLAYKVAVKDATPETLAYTIYTVIIPAKVEGTF